MDNTARGKDIFLKVIGILLIFAAMVNLTGCASTMQESKVEVENLSHLSPVQAEETEYILQLLSILPGGTFLRPVQAEETEYILQPGDVISVAFFYFPRLDTTVKIRPDGYISMVPIDDVKSAGLTARELDEKLTRLYAERIENPELTVTVKEFATQKIYVGGEVKSAGIYNLEMNTTALQAIFKAGGALNTGNLESVIIIRRERDGAPRVFSVNLARDIESKKITNDVFLRPLDVVYIPKTYIAKIDEFVDQYIHKLIPISLNAGFSYVIGNWRPR